jgi:N,N'-diacetyllegionaminate synthase
MGDTFIIAELGSLAEGRQDVMLRQINAAADAGCDAVKAQWVSNPARLVARRHAKDYAGAYEHIAYPLAWLGVMREHAKARGMEFGCSCYLPEDAATIAPFVDWIKLASFEAADRRLLEAALVTGREVIVSLGMGADVPTVSMPLLPAATWLGKIRLLHCVSAYPAPVEACNLRLLQTQAPIFDGFSDHTANVLTGAFAVCAGASVIEFHLRLDDSNPSDPDYSCALSPSQAAEYVRLIRLAEMAMGDGVKAMQECERECSQYRVTP